MGPEKRRAGRAVGVASLRPGTAVLVKIKRSRVDGRVQRVRVVTFASLEQARAELARREARHRRSHHTAP